MMNIPGALRSHFGSPVNVLLFRSAHRPLGHLPRRVAFACNAILIFWESPRLATFSRAPAFVLSRSCFLRTKWPEIVMQLMRPIE